MQQGMKKGGQCEGGSDKKGGTAVTHGRRTMADGGVDDVDSVCRDLNE